ncbi:MAG: hypothetical protein ABSD82_06315 [Solirubrobacteraceae bacterium]
MALRHPAWRQFEAWSIQADDATEAALLGLGLGRAHLSALPPILRRSALPDLVDVHDAIRLNLPGDEVIGKLKEAERFVAAMAIPFAVAVLNDLLAVALEMFQSAGAAVAIGDPFELVLQRLRDALTAHCAVAVSDNASRLLSFLQRLRNDIVHSGGRTTQKQIGRWNELNADQQARWEAAAKRLATLTVGRMTHLGAGEVRATWSVTRGYAREVNDVMTTALPRSVWARIAAEDFKLVRPTKLNDPTRVVVHAVRYARSWYAELDLTEDTIASGLEASPWAFSAFGYAATHSRLLTRLGRPPPVPRRVTWRHQEERHAAKR